jgi:hypothetical protein
MSGERVLPAVRSFDGLERLGVAVRHPDRAVTHVIGRLRRKAGRVENRVFGDAVTEEDWDNLIILDGCRYDMFAERSSLPGRLEKRRSAGSATKEFVRNTFVGRQFFDTVYVSANPYVSKLVDDGFHHLEPVWKTRWDEETGTVLPGPMTESVREVAERFPDKRLVAHYMQPHHPFLGPTAERELGGTVGNEQARREAAGGAPTDREPSRVDHVWDRFRDGDVDESVVRRAYYETLEEVLPWVADLCEDLPGKTVVTSDHGNLLDEPAYPIISAGSRRFAHPTYGTAASLVTVPWQVCPFEERKTVVAEPPAEDAGTVTGETVTERLEALGYR